MPASRARRRTAGDAIGLAAPARGIPRGAGRGSVNRAGCGAGFDGAVLPSSRPSPPDTPAATLGTGLGSGWVVLCTSCSPGTFNRTRPDPTETLSPILAPSQMISPSTGEGISTVALSVITAARVVSADTTSPTLTCHSTSSASATPSPTSGSLITCSAISCRHSFEQRASDAVRIRKVVPFLRMRIRRVPAGDPHDGCLEMIEAGLLHQRGKLRAKARGQCRLVHDDAPAGLAHRCLDRIEIERHQRAKIDDLRVNAGLRGG